MSQQVDIISATFTETEIISVNFTVVDILHYLEKTTTTELITEVPVRLSSIRFQTSKPFVSGTVKFFLNGLKEKQADLTEISTTIFEIAEAVLLDDYVEVEYLELT
jgi:tRNA A37 N6-isopentenylltransferase MiaA